MGQLRLLPLVALVAICLLGLKGASFVMNGSGMLTGVAPASADNKARRPASGADALSIENASKGLQHAVAEPAEAEEAGAKQPEAPKGVASQPAEQARPELQAVDPAEDAQERRDQIVTGATEGESGPSARMTPSEGDVLNALVRRRKDLDQRERELTLRENLLKAAEKKVEGRIGELKAIEEKVSGSFKEEEAAHKAELQRLVQMYAQMKPKDAATVFNRLEISVLTRMVRLMKPGEMSAILASMNPAAAERLTLEIAAHGVPAPPPAPVEGAELPKIDGSAAAN